MLPKTRSKIVIGIDPGFDRVGWAIGQKIGQSVKAIDYGCIQTQKTESITRRYQQIVQHLQNVLEQYKPEICGIEQVFFSKNVTTATRVAEARGVIIATLLAHQVAIIELSPQAIKLAATGHGAADKLAVKKMVALQLKISKTKLLDDTVDALAALLAIPK